MRQRGANEKVLMENCAMLDLILEIHQYRILHELCLQETLLVNGTVEEALIAEVPEEIHGVVFDEEVLGEGTGEISDLIPEQVHCLIGRVVVYDSPKLAMEQSEKGVILLEDLMQNFAIFFAERAVLELRISNRFSVLRAFLSIFDSVKALRVLYHDIEPNVRFDLGEDVGVRAGCDALNGRLHFREWLEKVDDALADAHLLPLLVNVHRARVEEVNLAVCEFFF